MFVIVVETKGTVRRMSNVLPLTKPADVVASPVILLGSVAKRPTNRSNTGRMLDSLNSLTMTLLRTNVYLLSRLIMCIIARTALVIYWKLNTFQCKCLSTRGLVFDPENVLDLETYHRLKARKGVQLMPSTLRVYAYGSTTPLNSILGTVSGRVKCNSAEIVAKFVVVHNQHAGCLLGRQTATQLGLLRVGPQVSSINCAVPPHSLRQRYPSVFDGVGKLTNYQQKISINTNIKPVAQPPRRIPFHVRKQVSAKLEELERLDIMEKVRGPTPWVSPLVVVPKSSGEIRVCVDMRQVNTAVIRERNPIPTVEESLQDLNGAAVFSKLDLKCRNTHECFRGSQYSGPSQFLSAIYPSFLHHRLLPFRANPLSCAMAMDQYPSILV